MANPEIKFAPGEMEKIKSILKESWELNREVGARLCGSDEGLVLGTKCIGEACSLEIRDCGGLPEVGSIHTHPHSAPYLNDSDIIAGAKMGDKIMCVCGNLKAPAVVFDASKPEPFENLACRCARIDADEAAYEKIREIAEKYDEAIEKELRKLEEENRRLEREGAPYRVVVSHMNTRSYWKMLEEAEPYTRKIMEKLRYSIFHIK
ncbi:MAG: hypothetical protein QXG35_00350 [Nitrososphaerota archaeon]